MTDLVGSIDDVQGVGNSVSAIEMNELNQQRFEEADQRAEFDDLAQQAIGVAIDRPGGSGNISEKRAELLAGGGGVVGEAKSELVSDVARAGTEGSVAENQEVENTLEDRMMSLYSDLTDYQVAWKIAQKIPQDLSQILKGN
ncbi:MAG: hypothetical protein ABJO67_02340 [Pseudoruegeria sp.]